MIKLAFMMTFLGGPAWAQMPVEIEEPLLNVLDQYGTHVGALSACNRGPGKSSIRAQAEKIGEWRHPSFWSAITGDRDDYVEKITAHAEFNYSIAAIKGCTGAGAMAATLLIGDIEAAIEKYTNLP